MDLKKKSNILAEEEPKYIISLKEGYRILHIIMSISFRAGTDTMVFDIGFTGIVFVFFIYTLNGMTKRCERYKEKVVYSCLFTKREYNLSDIASSNEKIEEFYKDYGDGNVTSSWDKVTTFYNKQGKKLFKFGLAYDNVQLLVKEVKNTQKSISNQKRKK